MFSGNPEPSGAVSSVRLILEGVVRAYAISTIYADQLHKFETNADARSTQHRRSASNGIDKPRRLSVSGGLSI